MCHLLITMGIHWEFFDNFLANTCWRVGRGPSVSVLKMSYIWFYHHTFVYWSCKNNFPCIILRVQMEIFIRNMSWLILNKFKESKFSFALQDPLCRSRTGVWYAKLGRTVSFALPVVSVSRLLTSLLCDGWWCMQRLEQRITFLLDLKRAPPSPTHHYFLSKRPFQCM